MDVGDDRRSALIGVAVAITAGVTPVMDGDDEDVGDEDTEGA